MRDEQLLGRVVRRGGNGSRGSGGVDYRIRELYQVPADLRATRVSQALAASHQPNPRQLAIGRAFLGVGFALAPGFGQRSVPTA